MMQCSEYSDPGDTKASRYWGYGRNKEKTFSHPDSNGSGPGGELGGVYIRQRPSLGE